MIFYCLPSKTYSLEEQINQNSKIIALINQYSACLGYYRHYYLALWY